MSYLCEGSSMNSFIPMRLGRGKVVSTRLYSIGSRVVQHRFTLVLRIKDHSCRIQSVQ